MTALVAVAGETQLAVERARDLLAKATRVDEAKKIRDQADAMALYMRKRKASLEAQNDAAEIGIIAMRRIGELTRAMERSAGPGRGRKVSADRTTFGKQLEAEGLSRQEAALCQKLAAAPERTITAHIAAVRERAARLTKSGTIAALSHGVDYESDEWGTDLELLAAVRKVLGGIDVDPATNAWAQRNVRARRFYTKRDNGLVQRWTGRVFCNPPFSHPLVSEFVAKWIEEHEAKRLRAGILLLNATTDTSYFHELVARYPVCLTKGRRSFLQRNGKPVPGNRSGQAIFATGISLAKFRRDFGEFGTVMEAA